MTCFPCTHKSEKPYPYDSMAWFKSLDKLCEDCTKKFEAMKPPSTKYILTTKTETANAEPKNVWMPKQIAVKPDFQERPDNRGELME